ncbi:TetR/AcrR family transcriptional regulator [Actinomadura rupiterrae]|uniref:TetR/AcrR family transcriptional regulator n=1 Tax=Actinomadura rupiterrae TaxID=559627 RepID=UPI0020A59B02|nr:TetR/AcrR family transcriptional regulator [Actinomadura rupiterrae]MCP2341867.1 AcrR family transcriptional regulator [Actinomadura rupiterrae]
MTDSRTALLDAAAEEFARHGFKGARVQEVVRRAGVNERMIYHHFGNKEGLYRAVVQDLRRRTGELWTPVLAEAVAMEPVDGVRHALRGLFVSLDTVPQMIAVMLHEWLSGEWRSSMPGPDELPVELRKLYERGQDSGTFTPDVPFEVVYGSVIGSVISTNVFVGRFAEFNPGSIPADKATQRELAIEQLLYGMSTRTRTR